MTNTTPAPGIDEQIAFLSERVNALDNLTTRVLPDFTMDCHRAILATLRAHKAIMEAERPEPVAKYGGRRIEPTGTNECWAFLLGKPANDPPEGTKLYGPDLLAYAERMRVERDTERTYADLMRANAAGWNKDYVAEKERGDKWMADCELAESKLNALVRLMKEPDEEMQLAGRKACCEVADRMETAKLVATSTIDFWQRVGHQPADGVFKAMSAVALRKILG